MTQEKVLLKEGLLEKLSTCCAKVVRLIILPVQIDMYYTKEQLRLPLSRRNIIRDFYDGFPAQDLNQKKSGIKRFCFRFLLTQEKLLLKEGLLERLSLYEHGMEACLFRRRSQDLGLGGQKNTSRNRAQRGFLFARSAKFFLGFAPPNRFCPPPDGH